LGRWGLLIAYGNRNVLYEVGWAHALNIPTILITRDIKETPSMLLSYLHVMYEPEQIRKTLAPRLVRAIVDVLLSSDVSELAKRIDPSTQEIIEKRRDQIFVSYSHKDKNCLDRLLVHLRPLEKQGIIDMWADTKLRPGDTWKKEIELALKRAKVAIMLVSADFLASDFIIENELPPLLEAAEAEGVRIIPVILKPCRFLRDPNLSKFHSINDPNEPLLKLRDVEQEEIYANIAEAVEFS